MAEPSPAEAGESTEQRPAEGCRTVHVTVTTRYPALFSIRYRDQLELYEKFKRKLKKLGIPRDQLYWMDYKGDRQWVDGFDDFAFCAHAMSDVYCFPHVTLYAAALREELETSGGRHPKQRKSRRRSPSPISSVSSPDRHHSSHLAESTYCCRCNPSYPLYESRYPPTDPCLSCRSCCGCHGHRRHGCHSQ